MPFVTDEPGRRAWYCQRPDCRARRAERVARERAAALSERRASMKEFYRRWGPLVTAIERVGPADAEDPAERLAQAVRDVARARSVQQKREALVMLAATAIAWTRRLG